MAPAPFVQRNPYKGATQRCWIRLRFVAADGSLHERELLADTGSPCAVILGKADLLLIQRASAPGSNTNFGYLTGGWLELSMPELSLAGQIRNLPAWPKQLTPAAPHVTHPLLSRALFS